MTNKNTVEQQPLTLFLQSHPVLIFTVSALFCSLLGYWTEYTLLKKFGFNVVVYASIDDFLLAGFKYPVILGALFFPILFIMTILLWKLSSIKNNLVTNSIRISRAELSLVAELERLKYVKTFEVDRNEKIDRKISELNLKITLLNESKEEEQKIEKKALAESRRNTSLIIFGMLVIACFASFFITTSLSQKQYIQITENPIDVSEVTLRTKEVLPNGNICNGNSSHVVVPHAPIECNYLVFITATEKYMFFHKIGTKENFVIPIPSIARIKTTQIRQGEKTIWN